MKVASYTVRATTAQAERWNRASQGEGYSATGQWLAAAADSYLKARARAGQPIPLAWRKGRFPVLLLDGEVVTLPGMISPPFGVFRGTADGPGIRGCWRFTLVYLPDRRIIATMRTSRQCQALASELAPMLLRGELPEPALIVDRHVREAK